MNNGPTKKRGCTDLLFSIVFLLFIIGLIAASIYGWVLGDPQKLVIGWDSDANGCGFSETTKSYPLLYWPMMPDQQMVNQIQTGNYTEAIKLLNFGTCVRECPAETKDTVDCKATLHMKSNDKYRSC